MKVQKAVRNFARINAKKQKGNMMLNTVIALIISGVVTAAAVAYFKYVDDAKIDNEINEVSALRASTVQLAQNMGTDFTSVTLSTVAGLNFFPAARVSGTGAATVVLNQWKGTITVAPATTISNNDSLVFTYTGVPTYACKGLFTPAANIAVAIDIGGTQVKSNGTALNTATAIAQCDASNNNATIAYTMSR